jgi:hypothetical protein
VLALLDHLGIREAALGGMPQGGFLSSPIPAVQSGCDILERYSVPDKHRVT